MVCIFIPIGIIHRLTYSDRRAQSSVEVFNDDDDTSRPTDRRTCWSMHRTCGSLGFIMKSYTLTVSLI